jgi:hypothetical protein
MTALQSIIKEAKAIRKKSPSMEWKKAVAQASAIYASKHKGKSPVGKKHAVKKKLGALPIGFKGTILGVKFKIVNQYDIYNDVSAMMEDSENGSIIVIFDGKGSASDKADKIVSYVSAYGNMGYITDADKKAIKSRMLKFATQMQKEVKEFNAGKKKTIKKAPLNIVSPKHKVPVVKKAAKKVAKKAAKKHTHWKMVHAHERRVNGIKRKPTEKAVLKSIKHAVSVQKAHMGTVHKHALEDYQKLMNRINIAKFYVLFNDEQAKLSKRGTETYKAFMRGKEKAEMYLKELETHAKELKKHI